MTGKPEIMPDCGTNFRLDGMRRSTPIDSSKLAINALEGAIPKDGGSTREAG